MRDRLFEPVSACLVRHLLVPDVFWDVELLPGCVADLVAVDRGGAGDLHVVELKSTSRDLARAVEQVMRPPADYRWVAVLKPGPSSAALNPDRLRLFPDRGPGRVGIIQIVRMAGGDLGANILAKAERFAGEIPDAVRARLHKLKPAVHFA